MTLALITDDDLRRAVTGQTTGGSFNAADLKLAKDATIAFVTRHHGTLETWPDDYRLGALRLAAGLYRDKANPGVTEPFGQQNVHRRATDIQIEQLLEIGRFAIPRVG